MQELSLKRVGVGVISDVGVFSVEYSIHIHEKHSYCVVAQIMYECLLTPVHKCLLVVYSTSYV